MTMPKKKDTKKTEICIDCGEKTKNFYIVSINSGKIIRCANCHERNIIQSVRFDTKFMDSQQINKMRQ